MKNPQYIYTTRERLQAIQAGRDRAAILREVSQQWRALDIHQMADIFADAFERQETIREEN